jgi:hypothetical protein
MGCWEPLTDCGVLKWMLGTLICCWELLTDCGVLKWMLVTLNELLGTIN